MLTRDNILGVKDIQIEEVDIPEWGGKVFVRGMTGAERDKFESSMIEFRGKGQKVDMRNVRAKLASLSICDQGGNLLFVEDDIKVLGEKSASALQKIFIVAQRLSGLTNEDVQELTQELKESPLGGSASA